MSTELYQALVQAPDEGRPLVFAFHGTGGDERQLFQLARQIVPGGGVIAPLGDVSERGAARFFRRTGEGVYDMDDLARATDKMGRFVEAHRAAHPGREVYGFGYSNGANILAALALARPDLFDRVGLLHPLVTWDLTQTPGMAGRQIFVSGGQRDPISPLAETQGLIDSLTALGAEVTSHIHDGGHELRQAELTALQQFLKL